MTHPVVFYIKNLHGTKISAYLHQWSGDHVTTISHGNHDVLKRWEVPTNQCKSKGQLSRQRSADFHSHSQLAKPPQSQKNSILIKIHMIEQREIEGDYNKNCLSHNISLKRMEI